MKIYHNIKWKNDLGALNMAVNFLRCKNILCAALLDRQTIKLIIAAHVFAADSPVKDNKESLDSFPRAHLHNHKTDPTCIKVSSQYTLDKSSPDFGRLPKASGLGNLTSTRVYCVHRG